MYFIKLEHKLKHQGNRNLIKPILKVIEDIKIETY